MDKQILNQYISLKAEIADLEVLVIELRHKIKKLEGKETLQVADVVKGTRSDGIYGHMRVEGYPYNECENLRKILKKREEKTDKLQMELLKNVNEVDDFINSLSNSKLRRMLRYKYFDGLSWTQVAHRIGGDCTADGCRMAVDRFLQEN